MSSFYLCRDCHAKYASLRYDPACIYSLNVMPLGSLIWPDEHPEKSFRNCCTQCLDSIRRLSHVRNQLWRDNRIAAEYRDFWEQAQLTIPNWPGFKRLSLDREQVAALAACAKELDDFMQAAGKGSLPISRDSLPIAYADERIPSGFGAVGGEHKRTAKQWWQFWK
jgi:hypothetical protein